MVKFERFKKWTHPVPYELALALLFINIISGTALVYVIIFLHHFRR